MSALDVAIAHGGLKLRAEVQIEGRTGLYDSGVPTWYVDAAWLEERDGTKVRDLTDAEIGALDRGEDAGFTAAVAEAYHDWAANYDPTP